MERTIKLLPVTLTREEREERAQTIARLSGEIVDADRKVESEKEAAKARVKDAEAVAEGLRARQRAISRVVLEGREERDVECHVRRDRANRTRIVTRVDTGERVEERPMTDAEQFGYGGAKKLVKRLAGAAHAVKAGFGLDAEVKPFVEWRGAPGGTRWCR